MADVANGRAFLQRDLGELEDWANRSLVEPPGLSSSALGPGPAGAPSPHMGSSGLSSPTEEHVQVMEDPIHHKYDRQPANPQKGRRKAASVERSYYPSLLSGGEVTPGLLCPASALLPRSVGIWRNQQGPVQAASVFRGPQHVPPGDLGLLRLEGSI